MPTIRAASRTIRRRLKGWRDRLRFEIHPARASRSPWKEVPDHRCDRRDRRSGGRRTGALRRLGADPRPLGAGPVADRSNGSAPRPAMALASGATAPPSTIPCRSTSSCIGSARTIRISTASSTTPASASCRTAGSTRVAWNGSGPSTWWRLGSWPGALGNARARPCAAHPQPGQQPQARDRR